MDDGVIGLVDVLLVQDNGLGTGLYDELDVLLFQHRVTVEDQLVPLNADHLSSVLIHEIFDPGLEDTGSQTATQHSLHASLGDLDLFSQVENAEDVPVRFVTNGAQQSGHGKLLLPVDVRVHHTVDVGGEFNPASLKWNDSRAVELRAIGVTALAEEHTRRTVQLIDNDSLGTIDHK